MKGLFLSGFLPSRKSAITYLIASIPCTILFAFINPFMTYFLPMVLLISPITDNLKHEKDSKWLHYISTLPVRRSTYVKSYYMYFAILNVIGLIIGTIITLAITQNVNLTLCSSMIGIGAAGIISIIFPLTFYFGSNHSNVILMVGSLLMTLTSLGVFFGFVMPAITENEGFSGAHINLIDLPILGVYGIFGIVIFFVSYFASIKILNKKEL